MKKLILSLAIIFVSLAVNAQETGDSVLRSKKGIPILPQKGDWAIGVDAYPFLRYLGNSLNGNTNNSFNLSDWELYGRYFIADNAAINFILAVDNSNSMNRQYIQDDAARIIDPLSEADVIDTRKTINAYKRLGIAYQKFRGYGRLKGYYGIQAQYWFGRSKTIYAYGNEMTVANSNPSTYSVFDGNQSDNQRTLEVDGGIEQGISLGLISGVEYFFAPKISAGFNITLSATQEWNSQSNAKIERLNDAGTAIEEHEEAYSPKGRTNTSLFTAVGGGFDAGIYLMFHF